MATCKQDMPPAGGYAPINFERIPLKKGLSAVSKLGIYCAVTGAALWHYFYTKDKINNDRIEMRCAALALHPMIEAETDRMQLKQLRRNRDAEERIMKDVKGWEVGKWRHSPVYVTLGPDEYFKPSFLEYYAHANIKDAEKGILVLRSC